MKMKQVFLFGLLALLSLASCQKDEEKPGSAKAEVKTVANLAAPGDVIDFATGDTLQKNPFVRFSFASGSTTNSDSDWDIALKGTYILVNGGTSGPGQGAAAVLTGLFDEIGAVPANAVFSQDNGAVLAVPASSGKGWYSYNPASHVISPVPGKVLVFRTHDGKYAKMEIQSYYKDSPAAPDAFKDVPGTYTFRYAYQSDGTQNF